MTIEKDESKTPLAVRIGRRVKAVRVMRGFTQKKTAALCNMSNQTLSNIECGKGVFNFTSIEKLEKVLHCTLILVPNEDLI